MSRSSEEKSGFRLVDNLVGTHRLMESMKILTRSIRIPIDAATRRTPESEEEPMVKQLVIPPDFEVRRLIAWAKNADLNVEQMKTGVHNVHEVQIQIAEANNYRLKAIALHLGIESVE